jgi:hypothetical protein
VTKDIHTLLALAANVATPVVRKSDLELFIDFLREEGTIINVRPSEVEAEGYDLIRYFRPKGGVTEEHFDALVEVDPVASEMLARAVVEQMVIDRGNSPSKVHSAAKAFGYSFWQRVPREQSFEDASKDVELAIYRQKEQRKCDDEATINPYGDWSVIVVRQGTFYLTPLARKVFPVIYRQHLKGLHINEACLRRVTGEDVDRFDRCLRSSGIWGAVVGPVPNKKGFWHVIV